MAEDSDEDYRVGDDNHLQACFVLHKKKAQSALVASPSPTKSSRKRGKGSSGSREASSEILPLPLCFENEPPLCGHWRTRAFDTIWRHVENLVKDTLEEQNVGCFKELDKWICDRQFYDAQINLYMSQNSLSKINTNSSNCSNIVGSSTRRLSAAILFTGSVDSSDCRSVFDSLSAYLNRENRCHVARLRPHDLLIKNGVNGPLRCLLKQFIKINPETTDMEILASWHQAPSNKKHSMVVIVEDAEHSNSSVLAELLVVLSEWVTELPLVLILGMATTGDSLRMMVPASIMGRLQLQCFSLKLPLERLEAVFQAVLVELPYAFCLAHTVAKFIYEFFFTHDNTVTLFLRLFKISCMEHFCKQPLSFLCEKLIESTSQVDLEGVCKTLPAALLKYASSLPSIQSTNDDISKSMAEALWRYKQQRQQWSMAFQCFFAAGRHLGFKFADIFCGALSSSNPSVVADYVHNDILSQIIEKLRDLSAAVLLEIVKDWMTSTSHDIECSKELQLLQLQLLENVNVESEDSRPSTNSPSGNFGCSPSMTSWRIKSLMGANSPVNEHASSPCVAKPSQEATGEGDNGLTSPGAALSSGAHKLKNMARKGSVDQKVNILKRRAMEVLEHMRRDYLVAAETLPFHEVFCFKDVELLKEALTGETRKRAHLDLLSSHTKLNCKCCPPNGSLSSSLHDTSIVYILSQEHSELINVHDWYQSFEMIASQSKSAGSSKKRSLKRKMLFSDSDDPSKSEKACIQARFSKAVAELHVTGLLRLPKKRQPDSVQRVAFGL